MAIKRAGDLKAGDYILWDREPAEVTVISEPYSYEGPMLVEFLVRGKNFTAACELDADNLVILAERKPAGW